MLRFLKLQCLTGYILVAWTEKNLYLHCNCTVQDIGGCITILGASFESRFLDKLQAISSIVGRFIVSYKRTSFECMTSFSHYLLVRDYIVCTIRGCQRCNFELQSALNSLNLKAQLVEHVG